MRTIRQLVMGLLTGLFSTALVLGGIIIAFSESGHLEGLLPRFTATFMPAPDTPLPGEPTYTASPTPVPSATQVPTQPPVCPQPPGWGIITILAGDSLPELARQYGISTDSLRANNCLTGDDLPIGADLYIPLPTPTRTNTVTATSTATLTPKPDMPRHTQRVCAGPPSSWIIYIVRRNDTLYSISRSYNTTVVQLMAGNCLTTTTIITGQRLYVPNVPTRTPTSRPPTWTPTNITPPTLPFTPTATFTPLPTYTHTAPPTTHTSTPTSIPTDPPAPTNTPTPTSTATPI